MNVVFKRGKAKPPRKPRRFDRVLYPPFKAARYQLHAPEGTNTPRQGARIDVLEFIIVRRNAPKEIGKLSGERQVHAG